MTRFAATFAECSFTSQLGVRLSLWPDVGRATSSSAYAAVVVCTVASAASAETPDTMPPTLRQRSPPMIEDSSPYALTYPEELARILGIKQGRIDIFSISPGTEDTLTPILKGEIDRNGAGIKLEWQIGK